MENSSTNHEGASATASESMDEIDSLDSFSVVTTSSTDVQPEDHVRTESKSTVKKDEEIWLDDGTVVIIARRAVAFRVYRGTLANLSPAFRDLMATGDASKDQEMMDGVPVVHVDDAPESLRRFLKFVAQPRFDTIDPACTFPLSYESVAAVGRIGHKYQVDSAIRPVVSRILRFFTPPPETWIDSTRSWPERWVWWKEQNALEIKIADAIDAVNLIRLLDQPTALPFALYLCCLCEPLHLRNGVRREDGTVARLSDEDYERCVRGSLILAQASRSVLQCSIGHMKQLSCRGKARACKAVLDQMGHAHASFQTLAEGPLRDVFVRLDLRKPVPHAYSRFSSQLCGGCKEELCNLSVDAVRDIFVALRRWFGLQPTTETAAQEKESAKEGS